MKTKTTQTTRILSVLKSGKTLTSAQMRARGIMSPRKRISELRASGVKIVSVKYRNNRGNTAVRYSMETVQAATAKTVATKVKAKAQKAVKS